MAIIDNGENWQMAKIDNFRQENFIAFPDHVFFFQ